MLKKLSITMAAIMLLVSMVACTSAPTPTSTPSATPTSASVVDDATPELAVTDVPEPTRESVDFPIITKTEWDSYEDIIALLGEPDRIIEPDKSVNEDAEVRYLFFSKYNRIFGVGEGLIGDDTYLFESFGGVTLGMMDKQINAILGEPTETSEFGWSYDEIGALVMYNGDSKANGFLFEEKYPGITSCGIGIGSTKEDVISKYCVGMYPDDEIRDDIIIVGSTFAGIRFGLENGKVVYISAGTDGENETGE